VEEEEEERGESFDNMTDGLMTMPRPVFRGFVEINMSD
jgi:hypothetical protein